MSIVYLYCFFVLASIIHSAPIIPIKGRVYTERNYVNEWAVRLSPGTDPDQLTSVGFNVVGQVGTLPDVYLVQHKELLIQYGSDFNTKMDSITSLLQSHPKVEWSEQQYARKLYSRHDLSFIPTFEDPLFSDQWHLINTGQSGGIPNEDINIKQAWDMGYTGNGIRIAIVDDGYQYVHPDLEPGYNANSSRNFNSGDPYDPSPDYFFDTHGTACAGVALARNNSECGVGAAFMAEGSGIRLISEAVTDATEAEALTYRNDVNFIYSNSWGPYDDAMRWEGPGTLTRMAFERGVSIGRNGLGSIFVWAAGNGLMSDDNCNYDGYANSIYTIAIGAVDFRGRQSYYSEPCAAMLVVAPSSGDEVGITTTDLLNEYGYDDTNCTASFGGTSSATPLVAGVIALMLEANPKLTWRDVQHILVKTAVKNDPNDTDWTTNGAGLHINHKYGFGRIDAGEAVKESISYQLVNKMHSFKSDTIEVNENIPDNRPDLAAVSKLTIKAGITVEHVEVFFSAKHKTAADLHVELESPSGTKSVLATLHGLVSFFLMNITNPESLGNKTHEVVHASFGPKLNNSLNGEIVQILPVDGCANISNCGNISGKIALVNRGNCDFVTKVLNAQECGAAAVIVVNNVEGPPFQMGPSSDLVNISSVMVSLDTGTIIKNELPFGPVSVVLYSYTWKLPSDDGYDRWRFSTVRNWGESSDGVWTLKVSDLHGPDNEEGTFESWEIHVHGTSKEFSEPPNNLMTWIVVGIAAVASAAAILFTIRHFYNIRRLRYEKI